MIALFLVILTISLSEKHFHATGYAKYQSLFGLRKNCSRKSISSEELWILKSLASLLGWRLALATHEQSFHVRGGHLAAISCSKDEKIGFPDHSCRYEFYNNRSALIEIVPLEEGQLYHAGKDPSATCT